ncbi:MAG TPA: PaaI family thioesterase [Candidatus Angelobacter sp.]|nr:PaaI family thioesterase [Candidatus Angelobacter sp.]
MAKHKPADGHDTSSHPKSPQNHCFGCGKDNPQGMKLKFYLDEEGRRTVCQFKLSRRYTGPPGHAHGGIIATILDEAMGKVNKLHNVLALTKNMEIEYLKPVPLEQTLTVIGRERHITGRQHINVAEISNDKGEVLARSTGTFIAIDPSRVFGRLLKSPDPTQAT